MIPSIDARRDQLLSPGFCAYLNQLAISVSIYRSHITDGSSFLLCLLLCQSCMWPVVIPQIDLHALSTIFLPTVRRFLPLWHNVLPIITLDCLISSYHKVIRCETILQFLPFRLVVNQRPNAELSEVRGGISCSHCMRSEIRFCTISLLSPLAHSLLSLAHSLVLSLLSLIRSASRSFEARVPAMFGEESCDFRRGKLGFR